MRIVLAILLVAAACKRPEAPRPAEYFTVERATSGTLDGRVHLPVKKAAKQISMAAEPECEKLHTSPVTEDPASTPVFVYIKGGLEGRKFPPPTETVMLDQHGCLFAPRVVPLRSGQTLQVHNSDPVSHNIHPMPKNNRDWNQQQPPGAEDLRRRFAVPEVMIPVKCNIHSWMRTYLAVLDHPYFALATSTFHFEPLPPGRYTVAAWHELYGERTQEVEVKTGAAAAVAFDFGDVK